MKPGLRYQSPNKLLPPSESLGLLVSCVASA